MVTADRSFEVFYAQPTEEYSGGWVAICPHGGKCWCNGPGGFFCVDQEAALGGIHLVMSAAYLESMGVL